MRAQLKGLHSPDIDLAKFSPEDPTNISFLLEASIGPENEKGADIFSIQVCTPNYLLRSEHSGHGVIVGKNRLIVLQEDIGIIRSFIERYCQRCSGSTWVEVAQKLEGLGEWEFSGYRPHQP